MSRAPKATRAEVEARTNDVFKLILAGEDHARITAYAAEKWQLSARQSRTYISRATVRLAEHGQVNRQTEFSRAMARLNDLYAKTVKLQDYRTALSIQKEINSLMQLSAPPPPAAPVVLATPQDVLDIVAQELNAVLAGGSTVEHTRQIEALAALALKSIELTNLSERLATLETFVENIRQEKKSDVYH